MKRNLLPLCFLLLLVLIPGTTLGASNFPTEPITYIYPMPPGGKAEIGARLHAKVAAKYLGQPVLIENKPGASGAVGTAIVAKAKPDGYTIGNMAQTSAVITPHLVKLSFNPLTDFDYIMQYATNVYGVSVRYDSPYKTFKDVIADARKNPGVLVFGSSGTNTVIHIALEKIFRDEKVQLVHVPYQGGAKAEMAVLGGHVSMAAGSVNANLIKSKRQRCLVILNDERWSELPDTPTMKELGYKTSIPLFLGIMAPKGVPEPILAKLEDAFTKAYKDSEFVSGMQKLGIPLEYRNRKDFTKYIVDSYDEVGKAIKAMNK